MTTLNLTLPNSIQRHLQEMADLEGVPVNQFVMSAVVEKISALTPSRISARAPAAPIPLRFGRFWTRCPSVRRWLATNDRPGLMACDLISRVVADLR